MEEREMFGEDEGMLAALAAAADVQWPATEPQEDCVAAAERLVAERLRILKHQ